MSLILDALRRADQSRERDVARRVTQALPPSARATPRRAWPLFVVAVLAAIAGAWLFAIARDPGPTVVAPPPVRVTAAPTPRVRGSSLADIAVSERDVPTTASPLAVPAYENLPPAVRGALPAIELTAHVWSDDPAKRFVMVDARVVRPGEAVRDGLRIIAVTPDGAVFEWRGTAFRVSAR